MQFMEEKRNLCGKEELIRTAVSVAISIAEPSKLSMGTSTYDVIRTSWNCSKRLKEEIKDKLNNEASIKNFYKEIDPKYLRIFCTRNSLKNKN